MRALVLSCLVLCSLALSGCTAVYSVHPLYTHEDDPIAEPPLEGTWVSNDEDKIEFSFHKTDDRQYNMVVTSPDSKTVQVYEVHLVQLQNQLFMDVMFKSQAICRTDSNIDQQLGAVAHHVIARVKITQDDLAFSGLDDHLIQEQNMGEYFPLEHVDTSGLFLITSPTEVLRKYISEHADRVFDDEQEHLARKSETAAPEPPVESSPNCPTG